MGIGCLAEAEEGPARRPEALSSRTIDLTASKVVGLDMSYIRTSPWSCLRQKDSGRARQSDVLMQSILTRLPAILMLDAAAVEALNDDTCSLFSASFVWLWRTSICLSEAFPTPCSPTNATFKNILPAALLLPCCCCLLCVAEEGRRC